MKKILKRTSLLLISALMSIAAAQAQKSPQDMDRFIDALMKKMTVEEKIGQLNLPVTGDITTGQAKSSDVAQKIEKGLVGGLFNLKGVDRILEVQKLAVEKSRLGIPLLFGMDVMATKLSSPFHWDCPAPGIWRLSRNPPVLQPSKQVPTAFPGHSVRW